MNEITKATMQTPIEIALGIDEDGMTTARRLYEFLELGKGQFARWAKTNIENNEYYQEGHDWRGFDTVSNGNKCKDYKLTTDFAKHLSMESHSEKGKIARQYFIKVEDKAKDVVKAFQEAQQNPMKLLELHYEAIKQADKKADLALDKTDKLEMRLNDFEQNLPLFLNEAEEVSKEVKKRVVEVLGGKNSNAYHDKSVSQATFMDAYHELKRHFDVRSYKSIKRCQIDKALRIAMEYEPPLFLKERIRDCNAQMGMFD